MDELRTINPANLVSDGPSNARWYAYDETQWPNGPPRTAARVCSTSKAKMTGWPAPRPPITRPPASGPPSLRAGGPGRPPRTLSSRPAPPPVPSTAALSRTPAFDPGGAFDPSWLAEPQPENLVRSTDGPRDDVSDVRQFVSPEVEVAGTPVPEHWRGQLAAEMDALGFVTRFEDYDEWGNARRIVGPTGITTERTFDEYGRVLTSTLVADAGCNPLDDPLCSENLITTTTYELAGGPLASVTSPGGTVTEYGYDELGWCSPPTRTWRRHARKDGKRVRPGHRAQGPRQPLWVDSGWTERSRTEYDHYLTGQLIMVERPRSAADSDPSQEHYTYDVAGRMETLQDANHAEPNVQYELRRAGPAGHGAAAPGLRW